MKKTKSISVFIFIIFATVLWFTGCETSSTQEETIRIGAILPLTGDFAFLGEPIKIAMDIAVVEINNTGGINGKRLQVVYEDSKASPTDGVSAAKKLIEVNGITIITTFLTGVSEAVKPVTEEAGALLLAQTVSPRIYRDANLTFRFHYSFTEEGAMLRDFILSQNPSSVCLIHSSDPSTSFEIDSLIVEGLKRNNITYTQERFSVGTRDFRTTATRARNTNCDIITIAGYGQDISLLMRELYSIGITAQEKTITGNIGFIEIPDNVDRNIYESSIFTMPPFMGISDESSNAQNFNRKYREISGHERVGYAAYYAYDLINILADVLKDQESFDSATIRDEFIGEYEGIGGKYIVKSSGDIITDVVLGTIKNGEIVPLNSN